MSFNVSFTLTGAFADSAALAALAILAGCLVTLGAQLLARMERDDDREPQPITHDWSATHDHDD